MFLTSSIPEEILLAVLGNFQPEESPVVLDELLSRLDQTASGSLVLQRYVAQLRVLVQLRKLQPLLEAAMDNLTKYVNEQGDPFYIKGRNLGFVLGIEKGTEEGLQEGLQKGLQQSQITLVKNLLTNTDFDDERIAGLVGVSVAFVQAVRQTMSDQ